MQCQASAPGDEVDELGRTEWWHTCSKREGHAGAHRCQHGPWAEQGEL